MGVSKADTAATLMVHRNTVCNVMKRFHAGKSLASGKPAPRAKQLTPAHQVQLQLLVQADDTLYLDELARHLGTLIGRPVTMWLVLRGLKALGLNRKRVRSARRARQAARPRPQRAPGGAAAPRAALPSQPPALR
jgi:transposase